MGIAATGTGERLLRDVANAEVYAPHAAPAPLRRARAFITTDRVIVYAEDDQRNVRLVLDEAITGTRPEADRSTLQGQLTIETAEGLVYVSRGGGCGCRSALKALSAPVDWQGNRKGAP